MSFPLLHIAVIVSRLNMVPENTYWTQFKYRYKQLKRTRAAYHRLSADKDPNRASHTNNYALQWPLSEVDTLKVSHQTIFYETVSALSPKKKKKKKKSYFFLKVQM